MAIRIIKEGIFTSLQGGPRFGRQSFGFNPGGSMDRAALRILNTLLGNDPDALAIEIHYPPGKYLFDDETDFALGGADFSPVLNGTSIRNWKIVRAAAGSELSFGRKAAGNRCYLAVRGGFIGNGTGGGETLTGQTVRAISGDVFNTHPAALPNGPAAGIVAPSLLPKYTPRPTVRVIPCGEFEQLSDESKDRFLGSEFELTSQSDRMGYRLKGPELRRTTSDETVSAAVTFGTIQLLPSGQLIMLMADHQTSGGYPRIATVISADLPVAAQLGAGDRISFRVTDNAAAELTALEFDRELRKLSIAAFFGKFW